MIDKNALHAAISHPNLYLEVLESVDSTNDTIKHFPVSMDVPAVCIALMQEKGRGRRHKVWVSPKSGNLYLSYKFATSNLIESLRCLSLRIGVIVLECLKGFCEYLPLKVKWPNDIYYLDKKCAGILIETAIYEKTSAIIVGIGINLEKDTLLDEWQALNAISGVNIDLQTLCADLINALNLELMAAKPFCFSYFQEKWQRYDYLEGKKWSILNNKEEISGIASGIREDGALKLIDNNANIQWIVSGELIRGV